MEQIDIQVPEIIQEADKYVFRLYDRRHDARLVFHNYALTRQTALLAGEIARAEQADPETTEVALLAAHFLFVGYALDYHHPFPQGLRELRQFFVDNEYPEVLRVRVVQCFQTVAKRQPPEQEEDRILADAWQGAAFLLNFEERTALLKLEWELLGDRVMEKGAWQQVLFQQLLSLRFYTAYGKKELEPLLLRQIPLVKNALDKRAAKQEQAVPSSAGPFQQLEPDGPLRATQTFFRSNYRNHINLSAIADNKANIMISVNSILISVLITFLSYRNIGETQPMILLPVVLFLVTGLASLVFAVLSARPKVTSLNREATDPAQRKRNIVFFGNFVTLRLDEYESAMEEVLADSGLLYGNMVRDLYFLGKVLDRKYRFLTMSYNIFMVGLVATVGTFLFALFS